MKSNIQKSLAVVVLSFTIILAFALIACQKEQQLAKPAQADLALASNLSSGNLSSRILKVSGGGQGTFGADLDGDGEIDRDASPIPS